MYTGDGEYLKFYTHHSCERTVSQSACVSVCVSFFSLILIQRHGRLACLTVVLFDFFRQFFFARTNEIANNLQLKPRNNYCIFRQITQ